MGWPGTLAEDEGGFRGDLSGEVAFGQIGIEWESPVFMVADGEPRHGDAVIMTSVP